MTPQKQSARAADTAEGAEDCNDADIVQPQAGARAPDLSEARRLLGLGFKLCKLMPMHKRPEGDGWQLKPIVHIDGMATGYGALLAKNALCSIDPDNVLPAREGLRRCGFDLDELMDAGVRTSSTRPGSGGRSTFRAPAGLGRVVFSSREHGTILELRAGQANLQDCLPGTVYMSYKNDEPIAGPYSQQYANGKTLDQAPELPAAFRAWWERMDTDLIYKREQQALFCGDGAFLDVSGKGQKLAFASSWRREFNARHGVEEIIERHGYTKGGNERWAPPTATGAASVRLIPGKDSLWQSDHGSDPLLGTFDAWTAFVVLDHQGDQAAAEAEAHTMFLADVADNFEDLVAKAIEVRHEINAVVESADLLGADEVLADVRRLLPAADMAAAECEALIARLTAATAGCEDTVRAGLGLNNALPSGGILIAAENPLHQFYAYLPEHKYIHRPTRRLWPAASVDGHLAGLSVEKKKPTAWLDKHRAVQMLTWWPGREEVIADMIAADGAWIEAPGQRVYNQYRAPAVMRGNARGAGRWRDHLRFIYPDEAEAAHVERWLAQRVQAPGVKVNHALVLGGAPGIGKDTLLEPVKRAVGSWNWSDIDPSHVLAAFSPWMKSVVLRVNETRDLGGINRFAFYEHTKTLIAAPPDMLLCNEKHVSQYHVVNVMGVIYTTNNKTDGIYLPANDRRHFVAWSLRTQEDFDAEYWPSIWNWLEAGGSADVATFLRELDLSSFDPKAPPPKTPAFFAIVAANNDPRDSELVGLIEEMGRPDALTIAEIVRRAGEADGLEGSTLIDELTDRKNRRGVPHLLERAGYAQVRNPDAQSGLWRIGGNRCAAYARNDLSPGRQLSAARELARNYAEASA